MSTPIIASVLCDDHTKNSPASTEQLFSERERAQLVRLRAQYFSADRAVSISRRERLLTIIAFFFMVTAHGGASGAALVEEYSAAGIKSRMNDWRKAAILFLDLNPRNLADGAERNTAYGRVKTVGRVLEAIDNDFEDCSFELGETTAEDIAEFIESEGGWVKYADIFLNVGAADEPDDDDEEGVGSNDPHSAEPANDPKVDDDGADLNRDDGEDDDPDDKDYDDQNKVGANVDIGCGDDRSNDLTGVGYVAQSGETKPSNNVSSAGGPALTVLDSALFRSRILSVGIPVTTKTVISATEPQVSLICSRDNGQLLILPLAVSDDLLAKLIPFLPGEPVNGHAKAWGIICTAIEFFGCTDSSLPVDPSDEPYDGQAMLESCPTILFASGRSMSIAPSRTPVSIIIKVELAQEYRLDGWHDSMFFVDGTGTTRLIKNLANQEDRELVEAPMLSGDGKLTFRFRKLSGKKPFSVRLDRRGGIPAKAGRDYWVLREKGFQAAVTAKFEGTPEGLPAELIKWAGSAGIKRKAVKVSLSHSAVTLSVGSSVATNFAAVGTGTISTEVHQNDFAKAIRFAGSVGSQNCVIGIDPNGLLSLQLATPFATVTVLVPTLFEGARERKLLEEVRQA
ncbi:hypothetical protein [Sphingomonas sp. RB1R13]|uniref:hypothetical protein n=1 Tax=Sphingomonas sp. RB1R13 TaxID=3096159 RepID=UPI002FC946EE